MTKYKYWKWTNKKDGSMVGKSHRKIEQKVAAVADIIEKKELPLVTKLDCIHAEPSDKRQICNERMSSRYMVIQTPVNPFLKNSNYIHDLTIQDAHLRPKDSNITEEVKV
ncbi:unnamed protein product [marine sediment metagenome]|uniref:Uncharacterized protein n=1 Tax=marine sediment metagenome TaxID=412755 RepID=X0V718_9ZZZZ